METLKIKAVDFEDFCRQVREFRESHDYAAGIEDDQLAAIWKSARDGKKSREEVTTISIFYNP